MKLLNKRYWACWRSLLFVLYLNATTSNVNGNTQQKDSVGYSKYGFHLGVYLNIIRNSTQGSESRVGYDDGFQSQYYNPYTDMGIGAAIQKDIVKKRLFLQLGFEYNSMKFQIENSDFVGNGREYAHIMKFVKLNYLSFPFQLGLRIRSNGEDYTSITAGIEPTIIKNIFEFRPESQNVYFSNGTIDHDVKSDTKYSGYSNLPGNITLGIKRKFPLGKGQKNGIIIGLRYYRSITDTPFAIKMYYQIGSAQYTSEHYPTYQGVKLNIGFEI